MHYVLFYDYAPDFMARRGAYRKAHLELAWAAHDRGELLLGGVLSEPADGAMLLFRADSPAVVEAFVQADPYVDSGIVTRWRIRPWLTVAGAEASDPIRPEAL